MALSPMSSVLRMSIMNFLMVSNSCGRTLRELSMRKTKSTGPDLHFCSGPGEGNRAQSSSRRETSSHNALLCGTVRHFCCLTQQRSGITFTFPPHELTSPPPPAFVIRFLEKHHLCSDIRQELIYWFQTFAAAFVTTFFLSDRSRRF